ncbi:MAG: ATP-binding protein [Bdellovibrionota bacterium]|nr:ATP-binding protein [Bdellovibrionota bacterium]
MNNIDKEKQNLIEHIKNQQSVLLCASQLSKQIESSEIYKIIQNILTKTLEVDTFSLHICDSDQHLKLAYSHRLTEEQKSFFEKNDFFLKALSSSGITIYTKGSNFQEFGSELGLESEEEIFSPEVAITLRNAKSVIGILCVHSFRNKKQVKDNDIQFFSMLSSQLAPALESAELHKVKMTNLETKLLKEEAKNLKVVNDELEKANTKLNDFVAIVAHDLRNPLGAISGYVSILSQLHGTKENPDKKEEKIIQQLGTLCELSLTLVKDILEIGALGSGKLEIDKDLVNLGEIVDESIENVKFFAQKKSITLNFQGPKDISINVDKVRIIQVLINLLSNAIKFTPREGKVDLIAELVDQAVQIEVRDNGTGIHKEILKTLFDKEFTTSTKGTDGERGTGFGLPLCQDLIKAHESEIFVETSEKGSRFFFQLKN